MSKSLCTGLFTLFRGAILCFGSWLKIHARELYVTKLIATLAHPHRINEFDFKLFWDRQQSLATLRAFSIVFLNDLIGRFYAQALVEDGLAFFAENKLGHNLTSFRARPGRYARSLCSRLWVV